MVATPEILSLIFVKGGEVNTLLVTSEFVQGMQMAFIVSAILAFIGAFTSLARPSFVRGSERKV
jgi:hypothetical protein